MSKQGIARQRVRVALSARETAPAARLRSEFDEHIRRRQPAQLRTVLPELPAQERLIDQRLIDEVPIVRMDLVQIADAREKPPALDREAVVECECLEERLLDVDAVVSVDRGGDARIEIRVNVGGDGELRFTEIEAAQARAFARGGRNESSDAIGRMILRETGVIAREYHRNGGVKCGRVAGLCGYRGSRGRRGALQLLDPGLERLDPGIVIALQHLELAEGSQPHPPLRERHAATVR